MSRKARDLIARLSSLEREVRFVAPKLRGASVQTRIAGLRAQFRPEPLDFEGWGHFQSTRPGHALLLEEAPPAWVERYHDACRAVRVRLLYRLGGSTWLAYPVNAQEAGPRLGMDRPLPVHLVKRALPFGVARVSWDGAQLWFREEDSTADPRLPEELAHHLGRATLPEDLRLRGLTPDDRVGYSAAFFQRHGSPAEQDERRLRRALERSGGNLDAYADAGEHWSLTWTDARGEQHFSAIAKSDLTVLSAGICLSGEDSKFDLTSLVGVVEGA